MASKKVQAELMLLLVAIIWGFAFVAQRLGMEYLGPFGFNACRFLLGALSLIPLLIFFHSHQSLKHVIRPGVLAGLILFAGASFQQAGLVFTSAGNAGFITGLYIIFVPLLGLFTRQLTHLNTWIGGVFAVIGLYLLSFQDIESINTGDLLVLAGAICWALHVLLIAKVAPEVDNLRLAICQFFVCALLSGITALFIEPQSFTLNNALLSWKPIAYAGLISVGIAYTLQIFAQKHAPPAHAAIIMSLEAVAAIIGGWWILDEHFTHVALLGCALMLIGMVVSQLPSLRKSRSTL